MSSPSAADFDRLYQSHLKHLKLKGLQLKTIEAYARAILRVGAYFDHRIDAQLTDTSFSCCKICSNSIPPVPSQPSSHEPLPSSGLRWLSKFDFDFCYS
jgi:hypothetical protein